MTALSPYSPRPHVVEWVDYTPTVTVTCRLGHQVRVKGVTTAEGAHAALARAGEHQH